MPEELNGGSGNRSGCARLPPSPLDLLTSAASHDLNKTVYGRSSECGVCLEIVGEAE